MKKLATAILLVGCICWLSGISQAESYGLRKIKQVVNSDYYNQRPDIQDAIVFEMLLDFDGLPDDIKTRATNMAEYWGELMAATPINHRYYKLFAAEYRYWATEAERDVIEAIKWERR